MKELLLTITLLCSVLSASAQINIRVYDINDVLKAKPIDKLVFIAQYQTSFINDTLSQDKRTEETMMLKIGTKSSIYYSYAHFHMDSLIEADKAIGASQEVISEHLKQGGGYVNYQILSGRENNNARPISSQPFPMRRTHRKTGVDFVS